MGSVPDLADDGLLARRAASLRGSRNALFVHVSLRGNERNLIETRRGGDEKADGHL